MKACGETRQECFSILLVFKILNRKMIKNQTNQTFLADDNIDGEELDLSFVFNTFCLIVTAVGEGMVIYYIIRHAPRERPINKLVLIDQVCKTHIKF